MLFRSAWNFISADTMQQKDVDLLTKRYTKRGIWLNAALMLLILLGMSIWRDTRLVVALCIAAVFNMVCVGVHASWWKHVAKVSPDNLIKFYLASSILRMLAAVIVFLIVVFFGYTREEKLGGGLIVAVFYIALLVFDCIHFARVEKKN